MSDNNHYVNLEGKLNKKDCFGYGDPMKVKCLNCREYNECQESAKLKTYGGARGGGKMLAARIELFRVVNGRMKEEHRQEIADLSWTLATLRHVKRQIGA